MCIYVWVFIYIYIYMCVCAPAAWTRRWASARAQERPENTAISIASGQTADIE